MPWPRLKSEARREAMLRAQMVTLLPRLRRFARSLTGDSEGADDLVQMACERSLKRLGQYRDGTRFDSWLYRIVYTQWVDRMRQRQRQAAQAENFHNLQKISGAGESSPRRIATFLDVRNALGRLPEENRAAIVLVAVEGYTYSEASSVLGVPVGTVASRVARARRMLNADFSEDRPLRLKVHPGAGGKES